jgi:CHAT domain-containing protein
MFTRLGVKNYPYPEFADFSTALLPETEQASATKTSLKAPATIRNRNEFGRPFTARIDRSFKVSCGQPRCRSSQRTSRLAASPPANQFAAPCVRYNVLIPGLLADPSAWLRGFRGDCPVLALGAVQVGPMTFRQALPVLLSTALLLGGHCRPDDSQAENAYAEFLSLFCQERWIEGRIVGCSLPRPCIQPQVGPEPRASGDCEPQLQQKPGYQRQLAHFQLSLSRQRSKVPIVYLLRIYALLSTTFKGDSRRLEEGIASLLRATELAPEDTSLLSDLAALYLLDAKRNHRPLSLVRGLEVALQATARPNAPPEAFYNRALLLESLLWNEPVEAGWEEVLRREPQAFWIGEARARLAAVSHPREQSPQGTRKLLELRDQAWRELLPSLAGLDTKKAKAALQSLESIAGILAEKNGDTLLREAVARLLEAFGSKNQAAWRDLVRAHSLFERGYKAYQRGELSRARQDLATAARLFQHRDSIFQVWPRFYIACALQQDERYYASLNSLRHLGQAASHTSYWSLRGYLAWMEGQNRVLLGRPLEALDHFHESLIAFSQSGEEDNQAAVHALLAECLLELGRQEDVWQELYQGLRLGRRFVQPRRMVLLFNVAAQANLQYLRPRAARLLQDQAIAASAAVRNPKISYLSMVDRSLAAAAAADLRTARDDLQTAKRLITTMSDDNSRRRANADIAILEAVVDPGAQRSATIARLTAALSIYRRLHFQTPMAITAYEERSRLLTAEGNFQSAARDLVEALKLYERRLLDSTNDQTRWNLHSDAQRTYNRLIALYLEMGDAESAFSTAERSRQFSLYSDDFRFLLRRNANSDLTIAEVQRRLGYRKVLVLFKQLDSEVLIWIVRHDRTHFLRRRCDAATLQRAVQRFVQRLRAGAQEKEIRAASGPLFASLFVDIFRETGPEDLLVLVPDREIFNLPVAAVFTSAGEPLGKARALIMAPSVEVYLHSLRKWSGSPPASGTRRALILSDPLFDPRVWVGLPHLVGARAEGVTVSRLYSESVHLVGAVATRSALLREVSRSDVIHFAGHAIVNPRRPDLSLLLLAPEPSERDGALYQHEIYRLRLRRSPVVILVACDSASLSGSPGEGLSSLAHAFLSAGASAVVGTLWPVQDETVAGLMLHFHEGLQRGLSPERALQRAQIQYLEDKQLRQRDRWSWAAFQVIGASHSPKEVPDA